VSASGAENTRIRGISARRDLCGALIPRCIYKFDVASRTSRIFRPAISIFQRSALSVKCRRGFDRTEVMHRSVTHFPIADTVCTLIAYTPRVHVACTLKRPSIKLSMSRHSARTIPPRAAVGVRDESCRCVSFPSVSAPLAKGRSRRARSVPRAIC